MGFCPACDRLELSVEMYFELKDAFLLTTLYCHFKTYLAQRDGATAIEYGLLLAGICLAIAAAIMLLGDTLMTLFYDDLSSALDAGN